MENYEATKTEVKDFLSKVSIPGVEAQYTETSVTFSFEDTSCTLSVALTPCTNKSRIKRDVEGNEFDPVRLTVLMSYKESGPDTIPIVLAQLEIMIAVAVVAKTVKSHFADRKIYRLYRSVTNKEGFAQKEMAASVTSFCSIHTKRMKVDQALTIRTEREGDFDPDLEDGTYEFPVGEKKFTVKVDNQAVFLTRVA